LKTPNPSHCPRQRRSSEQARQGILRRIHRHYQTLQQAVQVGALSLPFTRIADANVVLDQVAQEEDRREKCSGRRLEADQLHLPYWAELWDSAMGLAQRLERSDGASVACLRVLDLGCGMGLSGTVAARLGAHVLFADLEAPALLFARLNSLPDEAHVRTRRLNWCTDRLNEQFDIILGADIIYDCQQWPFLEPFFQHHLVSNGAVLLGEPGRQTGDAFPDWIVQRGWQVQRFDELVATRPRPIRIFKLMRKTC